MNEDPGIIYNELRGDIQKYLAKRGMSPETLSLQAGLSRGYVRRFLSGSICSMSLEVAHRIRKVLYEDV